MKQAIAGVSPSTIDEVTTMVVWPTITGLNTPPFGRLGITLGRLYSIKIGFGPIFNVGNLIALLSIPIALQMFVFSLLPGLCRRYRLTNRRVVIEKKKLSWAGQWQEEAAVSLDKFDQIEIDQETLKGQDWYPAGDLVFHNGNMETFRLLGVSRPEPFRQTCLKSHSSYVGVRNAMQG